jgi:hypothetical protein
MSIRIDKLTKLDELYGKKTATLWLRDFNLQENLDECIDTIKSQGIEHIHIQTRSIDFLKDPRLKKLKGIFLQYEVDDISPLFNYSELTHLTIGEKGIKSFDYSLFKNLIFLGGHMPKKHTHFKKLTKLEYTYLFGFKEPNFCSFANCKNLKKLEIHNLYPQSLKGLENLEKLETITLERCGKLNSLDGIGKKNTNLRHVYIRNAKNLKNGNALSFVPNLKELQLYKIPQIDSIKFLEDMKSLEELRIHPSTLGVLGDDYYPLIKVQKKLNALEKLKGWKKLNFYLNNEFIVDSSIKGSSSELEIIKKSLPINKWIDKAKFGLKQYSKVNCEEAEKIITTLLDTFKAHEKMSLQEKENHIRICVYKLNSFNAKHGYEFIETGEREELCALFDNIAEAVNIDVLEYEDGITSEWREW